MKNILTAVGASALLLGGMASAAVSTTCTDSLSCTLTELGTGGTITVDGVTFSALDLRSTGGGVFDFDEVTVTGVSGAGTVALEFVFDPAATASFPTGSYDNFNFELTASAAGGTIDSATLSTTPDGISLTGGEGGAGVAMAFGTVGSRPFIIDSLFEGVFVEQLSASRALGASIVVADFDGFAEPLDTDATASIAFFRYELAVTPDGPVGNEVPLPAAALLFPLGLGGLAALRRKRG